MVRRVLRDPAQSEEVAQEVLVEVWRTATRFDADARRATTWIHTMAHRRAVDRVRSAQSAHDREQRVALRDHVPAYDEVAERVETRLEQQQVRRCLEHLTDLQRESVTLAYYGGYTYREVAELLDAPLGTVKTRMRDGLIRLRDCLGVMRMTDPDIHTLTGAYAADALDGVERDEFEPTCGTCRACRDEVAELAATTARLADGRRPARSAALRDRVLAETARTRQLSPRVVDAVRRGRPRRGPGPALVPAARDGCRRRPARGGDRARRAVAVVQAERGRAGGGRAARSPPSRPTRTASSGPSRPIARGSAGRWSLPTGPRSSGRPTCRSCPRTGSTSSG